MRVCVYELGFYLEKAKKYFNDDDNSFILL